MIAREKRIFVFISTLFVRRLIAALSLDNGSPFKRKFHNKEKWFENFLGNFQRKFKKKNILTNF